MVAANERHSAENSRAKGEEEPVKYSVTSLH